MGQNNKNIKQDTFYGNPPGRQRAEGLRDLGDDRGWATFMCNRQTYGINCDNLSGHRGVSANAMANYIEFSPMDNDLPITNTHIKNSIISTIV